MYLFISIFLYFKKNPYLRSLNTKRKDTNFILYNMKTEQILASLEARHPGEKEYMQAVKEVLISIEGVYNEHPEFEKAKIIERLVEPDRIISFRVPWVDDKGEVHVNLGYRVQFNNAIGPYKGGLRFHASVTLSILKFLGFEQVFKNALTTLPMGGAKGGSDFSIRGRSDAEIMRFCQAFMTELWHNLGPDTDVPAGDIGVGGRELGYLYGMYKKLTREHTGTITGKGLEFGGSILRPEATGFGGLYFVNQMLREHGIDIKDKTIALSGFGNVAWGAAIKATELGAKVVTISGPDGYVYDPEGISGKKIDYMLELRASGEDIVAPYADEFPNSTFYADKRPWEQKVDIALPCATQNELDGADAKTLLDNGVKCVVEISNMGCTDDAVDYFIANRFLFAPGKAVNAGGVATSGLEMTQNAMHISWTPDEVDSKLHRIMSDIHRQCVEHGREGSYVNYVKGANIAGFMKVARAMMAQGIV
jgi:glutamate dehydrogenase (NADP+)